MKRQIITIIIALIATSAWAQADIFGLGGYIRDNFTDAGIEKAKVYLLRLTYSAWVGIFVTISRMQV